MNLTGKVALVTGASQGLGLVIAKFFAKSGANLLICSRNAGEIEAARQEIETCSSTTVFALQADVSLERDVEKLAAMAGREFKRIDVLVCNAGVYGPKGLIDEINWSSWVEAVHINLLGTVLCCRLLLPLLRQSSRGKIVLLSGGGATRPLPRLSAYAASKAAIVRFGETLAEELKSENIDVNSVAPGALNTRMLDEVLRAGPGIVGNDFYESAVRQQGSGGTPLHLGAELCLYLASDESNGISGKLISAVWDPWQEFNLHKDDLAKTDIYTLRRVVPNERGLGWS